MAENSRSALMILTGSLDAIAQSCDAFHARSSSFVRPMDNARALNSSVYLQLAEPAQSDRSLRIVDFVAAMERADSHPLKSGAFD